MKWILNDDVSYCQLGGRLFFLDIKEDRYFQISETLERHFIQILNSSCVPEEAVHKLCRQRIITHPVGARPAEAPKKIDPPTRSILEMPAATIRISPQMALRGFIAVMAAKWQLKTCGLKSIFGALLEHRRVHLTQNPVESDGPAIARQLMTAAAIFNHVRPYIPIRRRCLIDSISMCRFLAELGLPAHIVLGVAGDPFSAHAWVQHDRVVLNDDVENVRTYAPIRVI